MNNNEIPVNALAGRVTGKGESFQQSYHIQRPHSKTKLPVGQYSGDSDNDISGLRKNRLVAVGPLLHQRNKAENLDWVVRCDCGYYETRTLYAWKDSANPKDCCLKCERGQTMARKEKPSKCCDSCRFWAYQRVASHNNAVIRLGSCKEISKHRFVDAHGNKSYMENEPFETQRTFYCHRYAG